MKKLLLAIFCSVPLLAGAANAQTFPDHQIKIILGYAPGGALDTVTRLVADGMSETLGQSVVVENKPGASGLIATNFGKAATPDGYTIVFVPSTFVVNPILIPQSAYDPVKDFSAVSHLATQAEVMITAADSKISSVADLVAAAKSTPRSVTYASTGIGGPAHLAGELFQTQTGTQTVHVPFKGNAPAVLEVMAGRVTYMFHPTTGLKDLVASKKVKPLAIIGSRTRLPDFPDVPTMAEAGFPGFEDVGIWFGVIAPPRTPEPIIAKLNAAVQAALKNPKILDRIHAVGTIATGGTPDEFKDFLVRDVDRWTKIIREAKIELPNDPKN